MLCSIVSSLASNTRSSAYLTVLIICPPTLKSLRSSRASWVTYSLFKLNRSGDIQHPCLTPLPILTLLITPWSSRTLTLWSIYNLLINLLSRLCQFSFISPLILSTLHSQMLSASLWSNHRFLHLCSSFVPILFSAFQLHL
jgi:hypothetical protein